MFKEGDYVRDVGSDPRTKGRIGIYLRDDRDILEDGCEVEFNGEVGLTVKSVLEPCKNHVILKRLGKL